MMIHRSPYTIDKQWNGTKVLVLIRVSETFFNRKTEQLWILLLSHSGYRVDQRQSTVKNSARKSYKLKWCTLWLYFLTHSNNLPSSKTANSTYRYAQFYFGIFLTQLILTYMYVSYLIYLIGRRLILE